MNIISEFPYRVDDHLFFSDIGVEQKEARDAYHGFFNKNLAVTSNNYDKSRVYIQSQSNIFGYFADLFNLIVNRLYTTQRILKDMEKEYHTAYGESNTEAEKYPYLDEDSCWSDINISDTETGDPDYIGERSINIGEKCFSYKNS